MAPTPTRSILRATALLGALSLLAALPGCAVVTVAGAAAGAVIDVTGAVVSTTGKVVKKTVEAVVPLDGDKDATPKKAADGA